MITVPSAQFSSVSMTVPPSHCTVTVTPVSPESPLPSLSASSGQHESGLVTKLQSVTFHQSCVISTVTS